MFMSFDKTFFSKNQRSRQLLEASLKRICVKINERKDVYKLR